MITVYRVFAFIFDLFFIFFLSLIFDLMIIALGLKKEAFDYFFIFLFFINNYMLEVHCHSSIGKRVFKLKSICLRNNEHESFLIKFSIFIITPIFISYVSEIISGIVGINHLVATIFISLTVLHAYLAVTSLPGIINPIDYITKTRVIFNDSYNVNYNLGGKLILTASFTICLFSIYQLSQLIYSDTIKIHNLNNESGSKTHLYYPYRRLYEDDLVFLPHYNKIGDKYKDLEVTSCKDLIGYEFFMRFYSDIYEWHNFDGDCLVLNVMVEFDEIFLERFSEYVYQLFLNNDGGSNGGKKAVVLNYELNGRVVRIKFDKSIIKTPKGFITSELRFNLSLKIEF
ncbi:hypothetical protein [Vibrio parahaemolyticus]|uniref:hypothetical protein n=1 Tax=Vibrio parahaemolyticus TaxID=670 RepID=UPI00226A0C22|nr:hypothetical protein [Vibrio parahaemolyticus]MCX8795900.1 hypothetical protein [Vibrio parahaemolyticus]